jgi:hypothetical protein
MELSSSRVATHCTTGPTTIANQNMNDPGQFGRISITYTYIPACPSNKSRLKETASARLTSMN